MDLTRQLFLLFTGFIVTSLSLPDDPKSSTDPSVFEMPTPSGFMRFLPTRDDETQNPVKFHFWSSHIGNEDIKKFPDWFHFIDTKPDADIKVDKNAEKLESEDGKNPENSYMNWQDETHNMFAYGTNPTDDKFDAKDVFPPYYNVFVSNAYPSWMAMPGFQNTLVDEKKEIKEEGLKAKNILPVQESSVAESIKQEPLTEEKVKMAEKDQEKLNDDSKVEKLSESSTPDIENVKLSKVIGKDDSSFKINQDSNPDLSPGNLEDIKVTIETKPNEIMQTPKEDVNLNAKQVDREPKLNPDNVPVQVLTEGPQNQDSRLNNLLLVPLSIESPNEELNKQSRLTPLSSEEKPSDGGNIESKASNSDQDPEDWKKVLYELLQNAKPIFSSMTSSSKDTSLSNMPTLAAMLVPLKDPKKPRGRSILSGNNVVINNADNLPNVDQNINKVPSPGLLNPQNNEAVPRPGLSQNQGPQNIPNNVPLNQGSLQNNIPLNQPNFPNRNQGNQPVPQPYVNQNNYLPNSRQPILLAFPYNSNNVPLNYALPNTGTPMNSQGNPNGNMLQPNPGANQMLPNNNLALVSTGAYPGYNNNLILSPGQNVYAVLPFTNGNGNMNANGQRPISNTQLNPNSYQVLSPVPVYNLVPVNNVLVNTKDEADE